jgi:tripartite-type tricarboxylate transporter receptor subunit TctC
MPTFRMSLSRRAVLTLPALAALPAPLHEALADTWPSKPVHIIVPFAPGGSGDITARLMTDRTLPKNDLGLAPGMVDRVLAASGR